MVVYVATEGRDESRGEIDSHLDRSAFIGVELGGSSVKRHALVPDFGWPIPELAVVDGDVVTFVREARTDFANSLFDSAFAVRADDIGDEGDAHVG